jgi:hypothetical protein
MPEVQIRDRDAGDDDSTCRDREQR